MLHRRLEICVARCRPIKTPVSCNTMKRVFIEVIDCCLCAGIYISSGVAVSVVAEAAVCQQTRISAHSTARCVLFTCSFTSAANVFLLCLVESLLQESTEPVIW